MCILATLMAHSLLDFARKTMDQQLIFNYGLSYLAREDAIALYAPELPLQPGSIPLIAGLLIHGGDRSSHLATCIAAAPSFLLAREEAIAIINHQVNVIEHEWQAICDEASLSEVDRALFWRRQFLNPFAFLNAPQEVRIPLTG